MKSSLNREKSYNIAILRTDGLGDMLLTLPMCKALKKINNEFHITLLASSYCSPILENYPFVDKVIYVDKSLNSLCNIFRKSKFDIVYFPRPKFEEALAAYVSFVKHRIGTGYRWYSFLFNRKIYEHRKDSIFNEAEYNLHLIEQSFNVKADLEPVKIEPSDAGLNSLKKKISDIYFDIEKEDYIILHPGSKSSAKDWAASNFGYLAAEIAKEKRINILITGIAGEFELCGAVNSICNEAINLCGKLSLEETIALISKSKLFISNSTGVLHIAAALSIPLIGLYPNTPHISSRRWGPLSDLATIISPPKTSDKEYNKEIEYNDDMSQITVQAVFEEAMKYLK